MAYDHGKSLSGVFSYNKLWFRWNLWIYGSYLKLRISEFESMGFIWTCKLLVFNRFPLYICLCLYISTCRLLCSLMMLCLVHRYLAHLSRDVKVMIHVIQPDGEYKWFVNDIVIVTNTWAISLLDSLLFIFLLEQVL